MGSVDISALGNLLPVEPLDLAAYRDNQEMPALPKAGVYTFQAPEFSETNFTASKAGALLAQIDPKIVGPTNPGYIVRFTKVSAKQFKRGKETVSQLGDYLRACGNRSKLQDEQAMADAVCETANLTYQAEVEWKAWDKKNQTEILGMEKFPSDGKGGHEPYFYTGEKDENGNDVRLRANLQIIRFIPAEA